MFVQMSYEGSDDNDKVKTVLTNNCNDNNSYNVVSNFKSDEEDKENILETILTAKSKYPSRPVNPNMVQSIKTILVSFFNDDNKIVLQAT